MIIPLAKFGLVVDRLLAETSAGYHVRYDDIRRTIGE
jgi:hypothetical protein